MVLPEERLRGEPILSRLLVDQYSLENNLSSYLTTVGPRFNEVPRDWGNLFVISRVRYIENLDLTNFRENNQNIRYIEV